MVPANTNIIFSIEQITNQIVLTIKSSETWKASNSTNEQQLRDGDPTPISLPPSPPPSLSPLSLRFPTRHTSVSAILQYPLTLTRSIIPCWRYEHSSHSTVAASTCCQSQWSQARSVAVCIQMHCDMLPRSWEFARGSFEKQCVLNPEPMLVTWKPRPHTQKSSSAFSTHLKHMETHLLQARNLEQSIDVVECMA